MRAITDRALRMPREGWLLVAIVACGVALRLVGIGRLSFAGDEETTTLAALALIDGWPPTLPGGLVYVRGLPFTVFEALAIACFGAGEASLRLFPVLFAGPRIFAAWWLARPFLGGPMALLVAALLAIAPLDVEQSRNARMYSMFATLDLVGIAAVIHLALGRRRTGVALGFSVAAVITHIVAVTHAVVPWAAALGAGLDRRRRILIASIGVASALAYLAMNEFSHWAYSIGVSSSGSAAGGAGGPVARHLQAMGELLAVAPAAFALAAGLGLALALWLWSWRDLPGALPRLTSAAALLAGACASPVLAGMAWVACMMFSRVAPNRLHERAWPALVAPWVATSGWFAACLAGNGISPDSIFWACEFLLDFPAPNWFELAAAAPGLFALALVGVAVAVARSSTEPLPGIWFALVLAAFAPALISGLMARKAGLRFEIHALAPLLVLAVLGGRALLERLNLQPRGLLVCTALLVGCAVRPDYTFDALTRQHGLVSSPFAAVVAPDHRGAAEFLRVHAASDEWIAAEDPLQQYLLAGRAELWLRKQADAMAFLRADPSGGPLRDFYTGAQFVPDLDALRNLARSRSQRVVWVVTSGECEVRPSWYRTPETNALLERWRPMAWFVGADGLTRVYRLVDGEPEAPLALGALGQVQ